MGLSTYKCTINFFIISLKVLITIIHTSPADLDDCSDIHTLDSGKVALSKSSLQYHSSVYIIIICYNLVYIYKQQEPASVTQKHEDEPKGPM